MPRPALKVKSYSVWSARHDPVSYTHLNDDSAADLALCNLLAFWTAGDADRVDRLFRQSGLLQAPERLEKWDKPHFSDGRTYGQATVAKAIADVQDGYSGRKPMKKTNEPGQELATTETLLALPLSLIHI